MIEHWQIHSLGFAHLLFALMAILFGTLVIASAKGTPLHRWLGRGYLVMMLALNGSALAIYELFGRFGPSAVPEGASRPLSPRQQEVTSDAGRWRGSCYCSYSLRSIMARRDERLCRSRTSLVEYEMTTRKVTLLTLALTLAVITAGCTSSNSIPSPVFAPTQTPSVGQPQVPEPQQPSTESGDEEDDDGEASSNAQESHLQRTLLAR